MKKMQRIKNIDAVTLNNWITENKVKIIDVRDPFEHKSSSISGSINIPLSEICSGHEHFKASDNKKIVIHCKSGRRSNLACEKILEENPNIEVYNLTGGIDSFKSQGYTTDTSPDTMPIERQVMLTVGIIVFISSLLSLFVSEQFIYLIIFVALGLMNAGITGWCGMAKLLGKLPWNK
jgi:rhodanese-related sulfurtransferase